MYADDTRLYVVGCRLYGKFREDFQQYLDAVAQWSARWRLPLNIFKCEILQLGLCKCDYTYHINGTVLRIAESYNDLGVVIDNKLSFAQHVQALVKKANSTSFYLRHRFTNLFSCAHALHYICAPYPGILLGPHLARDIVNVESVQRRYTKWLMGLNEMAYEERLQEL